MIYFMARTRFPLTFLDFLPSPLEDESKPPPPPCLADAFSHASRSFIGAFSHTVAAGVSSTRNTQSEYRSMYADLSEKVCEQRKR